ncbi:FAD dependent oxidoreductase [Pseudohyphozyma bogoriensis]|nr:FAD dependent oxidoreductase [Pseudohyphozyma bogoriensis]
MSNKQSEQIVIIGGGIMGLCSAYYLLTSSPLSSVTLVENCRSIAPGASSYAGGFLAGGTGDSWQGSPSRPLARLSWKLHVELAEALDGAKKWGFRECKAVGLAVGGEGEQRSAYRELPKGKGEVVEDDWLRGEREDLTGEGGVGQIDPAEFCQVLHAKCTSLGLKTYYQHDPVAVSPSSASTASRTLTLNPLSTSSKPIDIPFTKLLITTGPWTSALLARLSLPQLPISNLPGHSLLIRPALSASGKELPSEAVFAGISGSAVGVHASTSGAARSLTPEELSEGYTRSPEMFPRASGVVYVAGENSIPTTTNALAGQGGQHKLPPRAEDVKTLLDPGLVKRLTVSAGVVSPNLDVKTGAVVEVAQFCYRPITPDGEPVIDEIEKDVYVATGHGPWGITLAPATGKIMSEMMFGKSLSADISKLRAARFTQVKAKL